MRLLVKYFQTLCQTLLETWVIKVRTVEMLLLFCLQDIFYSRKNFERPELQLKPHRSFEQEVVLLDEMFADGAAYCLGTLNRYKYIIIIHYKSYERNKARSTESINSSVSVFFSVKCAFTLKTENFKNGGKFEFLRIRRD